VAVRAGARADGGVDPGDVLAASVGSFEFHCPAAGPALTGRTGQESVEVRGQRNDWMTVAGFEQRSERRREG
jgi:hypothetical protein